jgi:hypothetical protein
MLSRYAVKVEQNGKTLIAGFVTHFDKGWKFNPLTQNKMSRKFWPTPEAAVKRVWKQFTLEPTDV